MTRRKKAAVRNNPHPDTAQAATDSHPSLTARNLKKRSRSSADESQTNELAPAVFECSCDLKGLLGQYLKEARNHGVDVDSAEADSTDISAFDSFYLENLCKEQAASGGFSSGTEAQLSAPRPTKRAKLETLRLPAGKGGGWDPPIPGTSFAKQAAILPPPAEQPPAALPAMSLPASAINPKKKRRGRRSIGSSSTRPRGGSALREAAGDRKVADANRHRKKWISRSDIFFTKAYSLKSNGSRVSTGWQGKNPTSAARKQIRRLYNNGTIKDIVATFYPVYAENSLRPAILLDSNNQIFFYRSISTEWLENGAELFYEAARALLKSSLASDKLKRNCAKGERGPHFPCIIGHHRQYSKACFSSAPVVLITEAMLQKPILTKWHRDNLAEAEAFIKNPFINRITRWVSSIVRMIFPGVAQRFEKSAEWYKEKYGISPIFGQFWNFCINGLFPGQKRIHCLPHADSKNIVGVCVLVIYQLPGKKFNHSKRSWLVLWEAGVAIQLPPWTMVCYPSALLYHFNIDIHDFKFVTTEGDERPTPSNSTPIEEGDDEGRGSLVYFNQASMYRSSETDSATLAEARRKGHSGKANYAESIQQGFLELGVRQQIPPDVLI